MQDDLVAVDDELLEVRLNRPILGLKVVVDGVIQQVMNGWNRTILGLKLWCDPFTRLGHKDGSIEPRWD